MLQQFSADGQMSSRMHHVFQIQVVEDRVFFTCFIMFLFLASIIKNTQMLAFQGYCKVTLYDHAVHKLRTLSFQQPTAGA